MQRNENEVFLNVQLQKIKNNFSSTSDILYAEYYADITNEKLKEIFIILHFKINYLFEFMNEKNYLGQGGHYNADPSRDLLDLINILRVIQVQLKNSSLSFSLDEYYEEILNRCRVFLKKSGGSPIPEDFPHVDIIEHRPVFTILNIIEVHRPQGKNTFPTKLIGEGSYAKVFKYKDEFYNRHFVIKRAKDDLTPKEYERFQREFEEMKKLNSPYIVDVFSFDEAHRQYVMEFMDDTLYDYVMINNCKLTPANRKALVAQILKAFDYIHSKGLLHRDISLKNVLLKKHEDVIVVKISDFGLVKLDESNLTSTLTEFKGSLNDPQLKVCGFANYKIQHETYALTWLIYFVMTGRTTMKKFESRTLENFIIKGLDMDLNNRYQSIREMRESFQKI